MQFVSPEVDAPASSSRRPRGRAAVAVAICVGLLAVGMFDPVTGWTPACPTRAALGLPCPACGTLRGLHELAHGRIGAALRLNALTIGLVLASPAIWLGRRRIGAWVERRPGRRRALWSLAALMVLAFGAARLILPGDV